MWPSDKELEGMISEAGNKLIEPPSSVDELLPLLDQVKSSLSYVEHSPAESMHDALSPLKKALVANDLLWHSDRDVKVAVASCIIEITRITAPCAPYDDDKMKDVFQLIVSAFKNLDDQSSRSYDKTVMILELMSKLCLCVVMLDLECDRLITEMFQHFVKTLRENQNETVYLSIESIMFVVLEDCDDVAFELLTPLLASVKKDNEEVTPNTKRLGKTIFENCAARLKPCLSLAVDTGKIILSEYDEIVSSVLEGTLPADGFIDDSATKNQLVTETKLESCRKEKGGSTTDTVARKKKQSGKKIGTKNKSQVGSSVRSKDDGTKRGNGKGSLDYQGTLPADDFIDDSGTKNQLVTETKLETCRKEKGESTSDTVAKKQKQLGKKIDTKNKSQVSSSVRSKDDGKERGNGKASLGEDMAKKVPSKRGEGMPKKEPSKRVGYFFWRQRGEDMPKKVPPKRVGYFFLRQRGEDMPNKELSKRGEDMPNKELSKRLSFPSLVNGVRLSNNVWFWNIAKPIRQFQELLLIEWSPPEETKFEYIELSDFLRMTRKRKESEAARLLNEIVRGLPPSRRNANCLVAIDHEQGERYRKLMCSNEFTSLGLVLAGVWSDQPDFQLLATEKFRAVLLDIYCPAEIPFILEYDIVPQFEEFLEREDFPELQTEAALALIDVCSFVSMNIEERIDFDPVKVLLKLLDSPRPDVCEKAVSQLGRIAGTREGRDRVHRHEVVRPLLDKVLRPLLDELEKNDKLLPQLLPKLRNATHTLLRFCKGIDSNEVEIEVTENAYGEFTVIESAATSHLDKVSTAIPELSRLVRLTDEEVLTNACSVLACLTDDGSTYCNTRVIIGNDVCQQLVELLEHQSPSVVTPAIHTLENIALREDIQSQDIVEFGALPRLWKLLSKNIEEFDVWTTISSLTKGNKEWIKEKKNEVREKLEQYAEEKLGQLCLRLDVPIFVYKARKADMVQELNFLEEWHAEEEQSSKGKKHIRESELEKDANEEEPEEETANNVPERSAKKMSKLGPSDKDLCVAIGDIIKQADIATLKLTDVVEQLGKQFGTDLTRREMDIWNMMDYQLTQPPSDSDEDREEL